MTSTLLFSQDVFFVSICIQYSWCNIVTFKLKSMNISALGSQSILQSKERKIIYKKNIQSIIFFRWGMKNPFPTNGLLDVRPGWLANNLSETANELCSCCCCCQALRQAKFGDFNNNFSAGIYVYTDCYIPYVYVCVCVQLEDPHGCFQEKKAGHLDEVRPS